MARSHPEKTNLPGGAPRLANIQALRAFAVLLVVGVHLQFNEALYSAQTVLSPWLYHGVSGVDVFFVTSGFIMVYISRHRFGTASNARFFLLNRAARIYPPALLFTSLAVLGMVLAGSTQKWLSDHNVLYSFLLLPQKQQPLLGVSWTLIHELYFYLIFAVFLLGRFRHLLVWLLVWALVITYAHYKGIWGYNPWSLIAFHPLTFEFILGALTGLVIVHFRPRYGGLALAVGIVSLLAGAFWIGAPVETDYPTGWGRVVAFAPGAALMLYGLHGLEVSGRWHAPGWLVRLGDWSYSLYLSHILVISALAHIWAPFARPGIVDNIIFILVALIAILVFSALAYYGFERPVLRLLKTAIHRQKARP